MPDFLYATISEQIEGKILDGSYTLGEKLPSERRMSEEFGVSRNVVREALRALSEKGLVNIHTGKGVFVTIPDDGLIANKLETAIISSKYSLLDVLEVRESIELSVIKKASKLATEENITSLKKIYAKMEECRKNATGFVANDIKFHSELAKCTKNRMYELLTNVFLKLVDEKIFMLSMIYPMRIESAQTEHKDIIDAIEAHDSQRASSVIRVHLEYIRKELTNMQN